MFTPLRGERQYVPAANQGLSDSTDLRSPYLLDACPQSVAPGIVRLRVYPVGRGLGVFRGPDLHEVLERTIVEAPIEAPR